MTKYNIGVREIVFVSFVGGEDGERSGLRMMETLEIFLLHAGQFL